MLHVGKHCNIDSLSILLGWCVVLANLRAVGPRLPENKQPRDFVCQERIAYHQTTTTYVYTCMYRDSSSL